MGLLLLMTAEALWLGNAVPIGAMTRRTLLLSVLPGEGKAVSHRLYMRRVPTLRGMTALTIVREAGLFRVKLLVTAHALFGAPREVPTLMTI